MNVRVYLPEQPVWVKYSQHPCNVLSLILDQNYEITQLLFKIRKRKNAHQTNCYDLQNFHMVLHVGYSSAMWKNRKILAFCPIHVSARDDIPPYDVGDISGSWTLRPKWRELLCTRKQVTKLWRKCKNKIKPLPAPYFHVL